MQQNIFDKELELLHRSVRVINDELMEIEVDQKHVPRLLEDLGLIQEKCRLNSESKIECYWIKCGEQFNS